MKFILLKSVEIEDYVEIIEVDGDPNKAPSTMTYESEEDAIRAVAQYLGIISDEIDEVTYQK